MIDVVTHSEQDTIRLGAALGPVLQNGDVLALHGDLGAGKTHFVQGIAKGMGIDANIASPTFTILNYYENEIPLQHFDFYRLEEEYELDDLGFDDYISSGVTVIEWAEKFPQRLPEDAAVITIEKTGLTERVFHMDFIGTRWENVKKEVERYVVSH
ncbi:MAG: tRNA (adenosine(37)-N6)-threonylcarbamoyltransferase complex ATPase subunit type 1 TsaE [Megasphaera sp.]|jgi:tRNA threonylcarbamoyladenosine biosynthesis protein TsaE|nr:tRNA (adenosine(37)-N6)-threonylcarbamoyltransferase complex ATPase subunit type 1 TsaE [Megasphaera sp.]MCH4218620.1 tRNA (adenosine(37)-N6)-threonylcarbamoyltransferase complex ATPase subunit type 1 TsaE [Megasphaera sp.]